MFKIFFINIGHGRDESYSSLADAIAAAKRFGFDASITRDGAVVGCWSIIGGYRDLR